MQNIEKKRINKKQIVQNKQKINYYNIILNIDDILNILIYNNAIRRR